MCHISDFKECTDKFQLAKIQMDVFTAFFNDESLDIGLGTFKPHHVQGALFLVEQYTNVNHLKKWHPGLRGLIGGMPQDLDFVQESKIMQIAASAWHCWGVLNEDVAFYGVHLMTLGIIVFGYGHDYTGTVVHALPYMKDWFTTTLSRDKDPMYTSYISWLEQLESERASLLNIGRGSKSSKRELSSLIKERTERFKKAKLRTGDWLVEWLESSITHDPHPPFNVFQAVFLSNHIDHTYDVKDKSEEDDSEDDNSEDYDHTSPPLKKRKAGI